MSKNLVHYSEINTQIAIEFQPGDLRANEVFLPLEVAQENDVYPVFQKDAFDAPNDLRADTAPSNPSSVGWKYVPYALTEHALHDFISNRQRRAAKNQIDLEGIKTKTLKRRVLNNQEIRAFGANGILRTAGNNGGSSNFYVTDITTGDPRGMVDTAVNAVEVNCGQAPNTIVLGRDTARAIMATNQYREEWKFVRDIRGEGTVNLPDTLYDLNAIYVGALVNNNNKGQQKVPSRLFGDDVWIGYINPDGAAYEAVTYGLCLYTEEYAEQWWSQDNRADKLEYGKIYSLELVAKECGYLCTSVATNN